MLEVATYLVACVGALVGMTRWCRVLQREHYIPGSAVTVLRRWLLAWKVNWAIYVACILLFIVGSLRTTLRDYLLIVASIMAATIPLPMTVVGKEVRLKLTSRALRLAGLFIIITGAIGAVISLFAQSPIGVTMAILLTPALADGAAVIAMPFERRSLARYRTQAEARLRKISPYVIAVTGSWGKTSTKNHIRDILNASVDTVASPASWNNMAGLSRTVNEYLTASTEILVAEMGMYGKGEIRALCSWMPPDVAVICAVGPMHLERLGSMEALVEAKAEILEEASQAVLCIDDPLLAAVADRCRCKKVWRVGTIDKELVDVFVRADGDCLSVWFEGSELGTVPSAGGLHSTNVACAVAATLAYGLPPTAIERGLKTLTVPPHRGVAQRGLEDGPWVIDDTFNSNPVGARQALRLMHELGAARSVVVTPGMVELGESQFAENAELAAAAVRNGASLIVVGRTNRKALLGGAAGGQAIAVADRGEARRWVSRHLTTGDAVLWENDLPDHYP